MHLKKESPSVADKPNMLYLEQDNLIREFSQHTHDNTGKRNSTPLGHFQLQDARTIKNS